MNHLRYEGFGPDDIYVSEIDDDYDDEGSTPPFSSEEPSAELQVPCG